MHMSGRVDAYYHLVFAILQPLFGRSPPARSQGG